MSGGAMSWRPVGLPPGANIRFASSECQPSFVVGGSDNRRQVDSCFCGCAGASPKHLGHAGACGARRHQCSGRPLRRTGLVTALAMKPTVDSDSRSSCLSSLQPCSAVWRPQSCSFRSRIQSPRGALEHCLGPRVDSRNNCADLQDVWLRQDSGHSNAMDSVCRDLGSIQ